MFLTAAARWKCVPCLWQINLGETNKQTIINYHGWQVPLLFRLILLRLVQQHGDFGGEAISKSLSPPQSFILSCELDPVLQLGNGPRLEKKRKKQNKTKTKPHQTKHKTTAVFLFTVFIFLQKEYCFTSADRSPKRLYWHKAVLGAEGLHRAVQAQITALAMSCSSCSKPLDNKDDF